MSWNCSLTPDLGRTHQTGGRGRYSGCLSAILSCLFRTFRTIRTVVRYNFYIRARVGTYTDLPFGPFGVASVNQPDSVPLHPAADTPIGLEPKLRKSNAERLLLHC